MVLNCGVFTKRLGQISVVEGVESLDANLELDLLGDCKLALQGHCCLLKNLEPGRGLDKPEVAKCATKLGRNRKPLIQRTRNRENGYNGKESNTTLPLCHAPADGFSSTTLGGEWLLSRVHAAYPQGY